MNGLPASSVAVVIPCFEQGRFLEGAIRSVCEQSTYADEIIVVDDGGTEDIAAILDRWHGVRLLRQENRGLSAARNRGLAAANSDKVIFLDADDRLLPNAVSAGLDCFANHPGVAFVYGGFQEVGPESSYVRFTRMEGRAELLRYNWIGMIATVMFDRRTLLACGGFDETLGVCEDWDAYLRLSRNHDFDCHSEPVAVYQKHDANMSNDALRMIRGHVQVLDRLIPHLPPSERRIALKERSRWLARHALVVLRRGSAAKGASTMFLALRGAPLPAVQEVGRQVVAKFRRGHCV